MPVVAILALVNRKMRADMVVILGHTGGEFGLLASGVANFMSIAYPATLRLVCSKMILLMFSHILSLYH